MKPAKPHINNLSTAKKVKVGDMVCYDVWDHGVFPDDTEKGDTEHGLVVEISMNVIVKVRPLNNWNAIRLLNVADCRVIKVNE